MDPQRLNDRYPVEKSEGASPGLFSVTSMHLDTNRIYLFTDATNGAVHPLLPKTLNFEVI